MSKRIYFGFCGMAVRFWEMVGSGGYILAGGGWWWMVVGGRGWSWVVVDGRRWWWVVVGGGIVQSNPFKKMHATNNILLVVVFFSQLFKTLYRMAFIEPFVLNAFFKISMGLSITLACIC